MEYFCYAQIDENNICYSVAQLSGTVDSPNMIRIDSYDNSLLGKKYDNGEWIEISNVPESPIPEEDLQAEMLLNQIEILVNQEFMEDVLSQILLNQMEG